MKITKNPLEKIYDVGFLKFCYYVCVQSLIDIPEKILNIVRVVYVVTEFQV
jgi:hypothetical protein